MTQSKELADTRMSADRAKEVLTDAGIGLFDLDLRSGESNVNKSWKTMIGLPADAVISPQDELMARLHPDDVKTVQTADDALFAGVTERSKATFRLRHEAGHWVWVQSDAGVTGRDGDGKPTGVAGVHIDVSDRVAEDKAKDEFVAMISHELRTPLTSVLGALKMVNSGKIGALPGPVSNLLQLAQRNSNRLLHLVNELLDFKSLESGELSYDIGKLDAREVSADATLSMQGYLQDGQSIRQILPEGDAPLWLEADVNRLHQILSNLLSNAAKFSPSESEIELGLALENGQVRYTVRDHGPGVPEELQGRMFTRFAQAKSGEKQKFKSTGLGLSICKQMTEGMGGEIGYFNNDDGGATFWVGFPLLAD
ncbi:MAG: PAS domain-containing sensor histidine kinase [Cognatishimia sp.]